jgi:hypothetical protein
MKFKGIHEGDVCIFDPKRIEFIVSNDSISVRTFEGSLFEIDLSELGRLQEAFNAPR